jgi:hypothetical protein
MILSSSSSLSCALPSPAPAAAPRVRALVLGAWAVRPRGVHNHHLQRTSETPGHDNAPRINRKKRGGKPLTKGP